MAKLHTSMHMASGYSEYEIYSKSLTAVLQRATLLVEALGESRVQSFQYDQEPTRRGKTRHYVWIRA